MGYHDETYFKTHSIHVKQSCWDMETSIWKGDRLPLEIFVITHLTFFIELLPFPGKKKLFMFMLTCALNGLILMELW